MAYLRFTDVQDRPTEFLDLTSLTLAEFQQQLPPVDARRSAVLHPDLPEDLRPPGGAGTPVRHGPE